jgi:hypothetical protein
MATVNWTTTPLRTYGDNAIVAAWTPLTNTNADGQAFEMPGWSDRSVHVFGTFGGATVTIQGSNELAPTNWVTLAAAGDASEDMVFSVADLKQLLEVTRWVRPLLSGGAGSSMTVLMLVRRPAPA